VREPEDEDFCRERPLCRSVEPPIVLECHRGRSLQAKFPDTLKCEGEPPTRSATLCSSGLTATPGKTCPTRGPGETRRSTGSVGFHPSPSGGSACWSRGLRAASQGFGRSSCTSRPAEKRFGRGESFSSANPFQLNGLYNSLAILFFSGYRFPARPGLDRNSRVNKPASGKDSIVGSTGGRQGLLVRARWKQRWTTPTGRREAQK